MVEAVPKKIVEKDVFESDSNPDLKKEKIDSTNRIESIPNPDDQPSESQNVQPITLEFSTFQTPKKKKNKPINNKTLVPKNF